MNQLVQFMKNEMLSGDASDELFIRVSFAIGEVACSQGCDRPSLLFNCCELGWLFEVHVKCCFCHCINWLLLVSFGVAKHA